MKSAKLTLFSTLLVFATPFGALGEGPRFSWRTVNGEAFCEKNSGDDAGMGKFLDFGNTIQKELEKSRRDDLYSCVQPADCSKRGCSADLQRKINVWKKKGVNSCVGKMQNYYCTHSPWRNCNREQRYAMFMDKAKEILEQRQYGATNPDSGISASTEVTQIPLNVLPCIAGMETITLEPLALPTLRCDRNSKRKSDAFGLGQHLSSAVRFMTDDDVFYKFVSNVEPFNQPPYTYQKKIRVRNKETGAREDIHVTRSKWKKLYSDMGDSIDLQLELMIELLAQKFRRSPNKRIKSKSKKLYRAVRDYNGSANKNHYAKAVMRCYSCLEDGKAPWTCLEKIRPSLGTIKSCVDLE